MKKIITITFIILVVAGSIFVYDKLQSREQRRLARIAKENEKAPETKITLLEGWTLNDIANYLEKNGVTSKQEFLDTAKTFNTSAYPVVNSKPLKANLEGYIFPDTYLIAKSLVLNENISSVILKKTLANFENKFTPEMEARAKVLKMSIFEVITLASIIEKESGNSQEDRLLISGVFHNRLNIGMALQSDATVNYITNKKTPSISQADTELDTPYNTYKYKGLPPGPIGNPGLNSIMAALYPKDTDFLYFLTDLKTGKAIFSKTFEEHIQNKQKYLR